MINFIYSINERKEEDKVVAGSIPSFIRNKLKTKNPEDEEIKVATILPFITIYQTSNEYPEYKIGFMREKRTKRDILGSYDGIYRFKEVYNSLYPDQQKEIKKLLKFKFDNDLKINVWGVLNSENSVRTKLCEYLEEARKNLINK